MKRTFPKYAVLLTGFFIFVLLSLTAVAETDISKVKKLPRYDKLSLEGFQAQTQVFTDKPQDDKYLAYSVRLPKGWKKVEDLAIGEGRPQNDANALSSRILGKVAQYFSPIGIDAPSRFEILALDLDYGISARNWFLNYILSNSYTLQGMDEISDRRVEALYILVENGVSYVVRTVAEINGPRMVLASYYLPDIRWNEERDVQDKAMQSFKFTNPEVTAVEKTHHFSLLDQLSFDYPATWKLLAPSDLSLEGTDLRLINSKDGKTLDGEIEIHVLSTEIDTTLSREVQAVRDGLVKKGFEIGDLVETPETIKVPDYMFFKRVEVYKIKPKDKTKHIREHEYWLAVMVEDRYYYIVSMLTLSRSTDFYIWARNSEAFKSVIETMKPGP